MNQKTKRKPSEEKRWTQFYADGYEEILNRQFPRETLWKFIERGILEDQNQHDALVYFGRHISRSLFLEQVRLWGRVLKGMGIQAGDQVLIFGPSLPEFIYVLMASNMIGAVAVLPNLMSPPEILRNALYHSRVAFVFDGLEHMIADALVTPQFEHVVLMTAPQSMGMLLKMGAGPLNWLRTREVRHRHSKYISTATAISRFGHYDGPLESPDVEGRPAIIFSSTGTSLHGRAKQMGMSNEAMINMFRNALSFNLSGNPFKAGTAAYCPLPPFVCTGFFVLVLAPLFRGMTIYLDPRLNPSQFTKCIMKYKPQVTLETGYYWQQFFLHVQHLIDVGKRPDLSFFRMPIMGGEGCTPEALKRMNDLLRECGSPVGLTSGYGLTETFSVSTVDFQVGVFDKDYTKRAISVGYPFPGVTVGIFDEQGNELDYGQRGEVWINTPARANGYLNLDEKTSQVFGDEWIHTEDYGEMDERGMLFVYGRMAQHIDGPNGSSVYLFDIANELRLDAAIKDSLVCTLDSHLTDTHLVAHLIVNDDCAEPEDQIIYRLDEHIKSFLPEGIKIEGYKLGHGLLEPNMVGKTNRHHYRQILDGYRLPVDGVIKDISFKK